MSHKFSPDQYLNPDSLRYDPERLRRIMIMTKRAEEYKNIWDGNELPRNLVDHIKLDKSSRRRASKKATDPTL